MRCEGRGRRILGLDLLQLRFDSPQATAEKFELGGSQGVRAYPEGGASGDEGWLANVELRWQAAPGWQLQAFEDAGAIQTNRHPWTDVGNHQHLSGAGLGLVWAHDRMNLNFTAAWPTNHESPAPPAQAAIVGAVRRGVLKSSGRPDKTPAGRK